MSEPCPQGSPASKELAAQGGVGADTGTQLPSSAESTGASRSSVTGRGRDAPGAEVEAQGGLGRKRGLWKSPEVGGGKEAWSLWNRTCPSRKEASGAGDEGEAFLGAAAGRRHSLVRPR